MKRYLFIYSVLLVSLLAGCQRDDICPEITETTPLLIIRFYDIENPDELQAPQNLRVREINNDTTYIVNRFSQDSLAIPLRTDQDVTELVFRLNTPIDSEENPEEPGNPDVIRFSYGRNEEYLNRACAFKINYVGLGTDLVSDEDNWIQDIQVNNPNVESQNEAHVSIFF